MNGKEVVEKIGITYPQLRYFVRKIDAVSKKDTSQGHEHDFTFRDLVYLKLASIMRADGLGLDEINQAIEVLDLFWKIPQFNRVGALVKNGSGGWSYGSFDNYYIDHEAFYFDPKEGKEGSYKKTTLTHVPGFLYSVAHIAEELEKGDQLKLDLMSEVEAVN